MQTSTQKMLIGGLVQESREALKQKKKKVCYIGVLQLQFSTYRRSIGHYCALHSVYVLGKWEGEGDFNLIISISGSYFRYFTVTSFHILSPRSTNKLPSPPFFHCKGRHTQKCLLHRTPPLPVPSVVVSPKTKSSTLFQRMKGGGGKTTTTTQTPLNEARMCNLCRLCLTWISSSAHQCLPLLLLYTVGRTDDALWIRGMMSCIVAPHVGAVAL